MKGDYFGGRGLLAEEDFENEEGELIRKTLEMGSAKVSVVILSLEIKKRKSIFRLLIWEIQRFWN